MSAPDATTLRLEDHRTTLSHGTPPEVVITVGTSDIADGVFRHEPPTALEMEQAIDVVEDALAATGLRQGVRGELLTNDPRLHTLLGFTHGERLAREEVEAKFQLLASASLGHAGSQEALRWGRAAAAALLILRECMHHFGYDGIGRGDG